MIAGVFHQGSGLGNQLFRYVATRVRATDLGVDWAMMYNPDDSGKEVGFKGASFMNIGEWDKGLKPTIYKFDPIQSHFTEPAPIRPEISHSIFIEKCARDEFGNDIRSYDPDFNFIEDNTMMDGEFQDERYFSHRLNKVDEWLKVEPIDILDDTCVIGFRGGEFALYPDLFLTKDYWEEAIKMMREKGIKHFEVHTDDAPLAESFFSEIMPWTDYKVIHNIGVNWRSMRYAKYAIIANSSFFILPRLLRHFWQIMLGVVRDDAVTIAPRFWGRRNTKTWSLPQNYYRSFTYL